MSESRWTTGPWFIEETFDDGGPSFTVRSDHWLVAIRVDYDANARLIAAAPDLAEAVAEMLEHEPSREDFQSSRKGDLQFKIANQVWDRARAALSRAKGETT